MSKISERLEEERIRLSLNKGQMAKAGGASDSAYTKYASGERDPPGGYLSELSKAGVDVLYVLTGNRSNGVDSPGARYVTKQEEALLDNFQQCPKELQDAIAKLALAARREDRDVSDQVQK